MSDPVEFEAGTATYSVSLPQFEGPLDLLLHLCQKHELDILDIPMGFITKKYLEYLDVMTHMQLDIASEYLLMAATLIHIKSKMLLPLPPPGQEDDAAEEDDEDPREALIRRLLEYQKYKLAAAQLEAKGIAAQNVFLRGAPLEPALATPALPPLAEIPLFRLIEAFQGVLAKSKVKLGHDIVADRISITDRIHELLAILETRRQVVFEELFDGLFTKFDLVITFLALLEMTRLRMTRLFQTDAGSPLYVEYRAAAGDPLPEGLDGPSDAATAPIPPTATEAVEAAAAAVKAELQPEEPELQPTAAVEAEPTAAVEAEPQPEFQEPELQLSTTAEDEPIAAVEELQPTAAVEAEPQPEVQEPELQPTTTAEDEPIAAVEELQPIATAEDEPIAAVEAEPQPEEPELQPTAAVEAETALHGTYEPETDLGQVAPATDEVALQAKPHETADEATATGEAQATATLHIAPPDDSPALPDNEEYADTQPHEPEPAHDGSPAAFDAAAAPTDDETQEERTP